MFPDNTPDLESLEMLLGAARIDWWTFDMQTDCLTFSDRIVGLLGLPPNRLTSKELARFTRDDYRIRIHDRLLGLKIEKKFDEIVPLDTPSGEIWLHIQLVRRHSDTRRGVLLFGYAQQIEVRDTDEAETLKLRSNLNAALRENKQLNDQLNQLPIGHIRIRLLYNEQREACDYLLLSVNRAAEQILGIQASALVDKSMLELGYPVDDHLRMLSDIRPGNYAESRWVAPLTHRYCDCYLYNTPNDATELVILLLDTTATVLAHQALDEQEKLLSDIIQNAPVGIEIYDSQGRLVDMNACDRAIFGIERFEDAPERTSSTTPISILRRKSASAEARAWISRPATISSG